MKKTQNVKSDNLKHLLTHIKINGWSYGYVERSNYIFKYFILITTNQGEVIWHTFNTSVYCVVILSMTFQHLELLLHVKVDCIP